MIKKLILFLPLLLLLSCNDFLDREPVEQTSFEQQLSTIDGHLEALNGLYTEYEELYSGIYFVYADALGGNVEFAPNRQNEPSIDPLIDASYRFQETADNGTFESFYDNAYSIINAANLILENIDPINADESLKNRIRAEALAMRATVHFDLLKLFAQPYNFTPDASHLGIVYNQQTLTSGEDFPSRLSVADSYERLEDDYLQALTFFENAEELTATPKSYYLNALNVKALLTRMYLYQQDHQNCINYANEVIAEAAGLTPRDQLLTQWQAIEPLSETLFELVPPFTGTDATTASSSVSQFFQVITDEDGNVVENDRYASSNDLISLYDENDIRGENGLLKTYQIPTLQADGNLADEAYTFTRKFEANDGAIIIRLSEVYLNRAEAYARSGDNSAAQNDLSVILDRAYDTPQNVSAENENLVNLILMERRKELAFEGHLFFDRIRNQLDIVRNDGCSISNCNLSYPNTNFVQPIPEDAIIINENMEQNEGY